MAGDVLTRADVLRYRIGVQQLDRPVDPDRALTDAAVLDLGVQHSGLDGSSWALVNRGVFVAAPDALAVAPGTEELALAWTLRGAPHFYRRAELHDVRMATSPFSAADAGKRIYDANKPLKDRGITALDGLAEVAREMRAIVTKPTPKGVLSSALSERLPAHHLRACRPCQATHPWEMPFRLAALQAGLELVAGTSPPVLRRIADWPRSRNEGPGDPESAPPHLQVIRAYLHLLGPATPQHVAGYLDAPVAEVRKHWPQDAVQVSVDGQACSLLQADVTSFARTAGVDVGSLARLLGPFDLFLQAKDREHLVPDPARQKELWRVLGRPGAVLARGEIVGTWRPRASGRKFSVQVEPWVRLSTPVRSLVEEQAERLADHRGLAFTGVAFAG